MPVFYQLNRKHLKSINKPSPKSQTMTHATWCKNAAYCFCWSSFLASGDAFN
jgi:hypothetical protein